MGFKMNKILFIPILLVFGFARYYWRDSESIQRILLIAGLLFLLANILSLTKVFSKKNDIADSLFEFLEDKAGKRASQYIKTEIFVMRGFLSIFKITSKVKLQKSPALSFINTEIKQPLQAILFLLPIEGSVAHLLINFYVEASERFFYHCFLGTLEVYALLWVTGYLMLIKVRQDLAESTL